VVKRALANNAAALILCHNHPSGNSDPSQADRVLTKRLQKALELIDVRVLDHFIIGDGDPLSGRVWVDVVVHHGRNELARDES
jgi:DNA repair protein RadC